MTRPTRVVIDVQALRENLATVRRYAPGRHVMAIIKADGYGHGAVRVARALASTDAFGVASIEEAVRLREAKIRRPIVLLEGPFETGEIDVLRHFSLETVVHTWEQIEILRDAREIPVWIKIDTGMHRLGFPPKDFASAHEALATSGRIVRYLTHFANAHWLGDPMVHGQLRTFHDVTKGVEGEKCLANSSAILAWPETHSDWVRPGLMLYGASPFPDSCGRDYGLIPVMSLVSSIIAIKQVAAGGSVGYGAGFICPEDMRIGVVACGYADGYPRHATTGTPVIVDGVRTTVLGEASMDMMMVDLRAVKNARLGSPVELWGANLPVEEIAYSAATIPYELLCRMRLRAQFSEENQ